VEPVLLESGLVEPRLVESGLVEPVLVESGLVESDRFPGGQSSRFGAPFTDR